MCTSVWRTPKVLGCYRCSFGRHCEPASRVVVPTDTPTGGVRVLGCFISSPTLGVARLSHSSHPGRGRGTVVSIWVALMTNVSECLSHVYRPFGYPFWERDCSRPLSGQVDSRPSRLTESLTLPPERWPSWSRRGRALLAHHDLLGGVSGGQPPFLWSGTLRRQANLGVYPDSASDQRCDPRLGSPMGKMAVID